MISTNSFISQNPKKFFQCPATAELNSKYQKYVCVLPANK